MVRPRHAGSYASAHKWSHLHSERIMLTAIWRVEEIKWAKQGALWPGLTDSGLVMTAVCIPEEEWTWLAGCGDMEDSGYRRQWWGEVVW